MNSLTKENILREINERDLFQAYFPYKIDRRKSKYKNPFRLDRRGTCHFNWFKGRFIFFDNATREQIDVFAFIMRLYNCTFYEALYKINIDYRLELTCNTTYIRRDLLSSMDSKTIPIEPSLFMSRSRPVCYSIMKRYWNKFDGLYWKSKYGITCQTLINYNVVPLDSYKINYKGTSWTNSYSYNSKDPCYVYRLYDTNDKLFVKLYRPLVQNKEDKWRSDENTHLLHGLKNLPDTGNLLLISSSLKDGLCLQQLGYNFTCMTVEIGKIPLIQWNNISSRFKRIVFLLDFDKPGIDWSIRMAKEYKAESRIITGFNGCKDVAEIVEMYGRHALHNKLKNIL